MESQLVTPRFSWDSQCLARVCKISVTVFIKNFCVTCLIPTIVRSAA